MNILIGLCGATLADSKPTCDVLLELLGDLSDEARPSYHSPLHEMWQASIRVLSRFHDARAIPLIRKLMIHTGRMTHEELVDYIEAVAAIGGTEAIELLDEMMVRGYRNNFGLEEALLHFAAPSSGRAIWKQYLKDPIHETLGDVTSMGYYNALKALAACADADLFLEIRVQLVSSKDRAEKIALEKLLEQIRTRLDK